MINLLLYGFDATCPEYDLRLASQQGFVQRYQNPIRDGGCIRSFWLYETKQAAEQAHEYALHAEGIREVGELGSFETSRPLN